MDVWTLARPIIKVRHLSPHELGPHKRLQLGHFVLTASQMDHLTGSVFDISDGHQAFGVWRLSSLHNQVCDSFIRRVNDQHPQLSPRAISTVYSGLHRNVHLPPPFKQFLLVSNTDHHQLGLMASILVLHTSSRDLSDFQSSSS
jgi:hypothetical protein